MAVSRDNLPDGLLCTVKNYLNITWSDSATDAKIRGIIASGMMYLNSKARGRDGLSGRWCRQNVAV